MRILIVGLGSIGQRHLRNLLACGYQDLILCRSGKATLDSGDLGRFQAVSDIREALKLKPRAAFVCTPTSAHFEAAEAILVAGCHLFIEKPVSHCIEGCDRLVSTAREQRLVTMVGFQFRFHPVLAAIRELLHSGELGRVVSAHAHWGEYLPDWHPWEDYRNGYAAKKDLGGGAALTLCHPIDYLRWMIGEIAAMTATVSPLKPLSTEVDEAVLFSLRFANGAIGSVYADFIRRPPAHTLTIIAEGGSVEWDNASGAATVRRADGKERRIGLPEGFERNAMFLSETRHFMQHVEAGKQTLIPLEDGVKTLSLIAGAMAAAPVNPL